MNHRAKALVLLSGGLDSMLSARILMEQGVEVTGITFISNFFGAAKARKAAEQLGIKLIEEDFSEEHLALVKNPKYGYGKNLNPCIDCHALMLRRAGENLTPTPCPQCLRKRGRRVSLERRGGKEESFDFVATGEVLGQRPMSQNKNSLSTVAKYSGVGDRLVRPLSAQLLDETAPEKAGLIDRNKLLGISGRSRKRQIELAAHYGLKDYPSPAGGCLLTDPGYSNKLKELFAAWPECSGGDTELIKHGRVFWLSSEINGFIEKNLLVIGRNQDDNQALQKLAKSGDIIVELADEIGPTALIRINNADLKISDREFELIVPEVINYDRLKFGEAKTKEEIIGLVATLTGYYAVKVRGKKVKVKVHNILKTN